MDQNIKKIRSEIVSCTKCPRLVEFRTKIAKEKRKSYMGWDYWGKPVPGYGCLLYTSPSPRDKRQSRMPSSA